MTVVIVLVFIFCWTPYTLSQIWFMLYGGTSLDQKIQKGLYIFACTNSVMDPIVYGYFNLRKSNRNNRNQDTHVGQNTLALPTNGHNIIRRTIDTANTKIENL
jgi:gonadotropin-releasing hormone receptor